MQTTPLGAPCTPAATLPVLGEVVRPYLIRITCPGNEPVEFTGLFRTTCDAVMDAMDRAAHAECAVHVKCLASPAHTAAQGAAA